MPKTNIEKELKVLHDQVCQTCDGCTKNSCAFTEGYRRGFKEALQTPKPKESGYNTPVSELIDLKTGHELIAILSNFCGERGDSEGAIATLNRIIAERNVLLRKAIKQIFQSC